MQLLDIGRVVVMRAAKCRTTQLISYEIKRYVLSKYKSLVNQ